MEKEKGKAKKYYLRIEFRYSIPRDETLEEDQYQNTYFTKKISSHLFETEDECIEYGNKIIQENRWMEQYPGHIGRRLTSKYGIPLVAPNLKNGVSIFISVDSLNILDFDTINSELKKFNIEKIEKEIE